MRLPHIEGPKNFSIIVISNDDRFTLIIRGGYTAMRAMKFLLVQNVIWLLERRIEILLQIIAIYDHFDAT